MMAFASLIVDASHQTEDWVLEDDEAREILRDLRAEMERKGYRFLVTLRHPSEPKPRFVYKGNSKQVEDQLLKLGEKGWTVDTRCCVFRAEATWNTRKKRSRSSQAQHKAHVAAKKPRRSRESATSLEEFTVDS